MVGGSVTGSGMILFRLLLLPPFFVVDTGIRWTAKRAEWVKKKLDQLPWPRTAECHRGVLLQLGWTLEEQEVSLSLSE